MASLRTRAAAALVAAGLVAAVGPAAGAGTRGGTPSRLARTPDLPFGAAVDTILWRNLARPGPLEPPGLRGPTPTPLAAGPTRLRIDPFTGAVTVRGARAGAAGVLLPPPPPPPRLRLGRKPVRPPPVPLGSRGPDPEEPVETGLVQGPPETLVEAEVAEAAGALDPPLPGRLPDPAAAARLRSRWTAGFDSLATPASRLRQAMARALERPGGPAGRADVSEEVRALVDEYADLGMRVQARAELGGDWNRFRPCQTAFQESCTPQALPQLRPDLLFKVEVGGSIAERIQVDVDFDQLREFEATNTINIVYSGEPGERIRRLEVGDVSFPLPPSRFLTEGLPAGNFGFQADARLGSTDVQAVWAEQQGDRFSRTFRLRGVGTQRRFVQEDTLVVDDADYARGQFFFLVDPRAVDGYPHLDVLSLDPGAAPATVVPGVDPVQVYRFDADPVLRQQVEGFIQADAVATEGSDRVEESGWFRYLQPGEDYVVHPSGLWIGLRNPLSRDEILAVTYVTAAGDTVGDYNPERIYNEGDRPVLQLLKASDANHQPGRPTWERELRNIYRVTGAPDVDPASVEVTISLGQLSVGRTFQRGPRGEDITFLRLLGLDQEAPVDEVDPAFVYAPGIDAFDATPPVEGAFVVFPTLEPFKRPPPLPSLGLTAEETREILGADANPRIYDDPDPFERVNGGRFRLTIPFRLRSEGVISSFSLGALGVLAGSERIFLGERLLVRGVDYEIDYDVGRVTLLDPGTLFATDPDAAVRATWEQQQIFQRAPTSVFGLNARTGFAGGAGRLDLLGLYRTERTLVNRPTLGLEPGAVGLVGLSGGFDGGAPWLDRALEALPGLRTGAPATLTVDGEAAVSLPNPNTRDEVFLDDFDASDARPLSLLAFDWNRGSAPTSRQGASDVLPPALDAGSLAELVWQHTWIVESPGGDSVGIHEGFLPRQEIDQQIRVAGSAVQEQGLFLTFGREQAFPGPRWASVTTALSATGTDLTKSEFLEFYASGGEPLTLVVDLGTVSEDAFFVDEAGNTNGLKENGVPWGLGLLDQEADPARGEIWGDDADLRGVWGETCLSERGRIFRLGDPRAVCTRGNGRRDTEDLDGDGNLDEAERHLRWIVRLDGSSPFLARTRAETGTDFRLYRIPLQGPEATEVGGPFTEADLRAIRHLRITAVGQVPSAVALARLRIVGSRWVKRALDGVVTGIVGDTVAPAGRVEVTPVSRLTEGDAYEAPPGVLEELSDPSGAFGGTGVEFNEKSLSLRLDRIGPGDRAEVVNRFPQRPRNFLSYREARLWVVARSGGFGPDEPAEFFFKVGTDPENFYLYRTRLPAPPAGGAVQSADWIPEVRIDFEEWLRLRQRAEELLIVDPPRAGDPPVRVFSPDSTYAVILRNRGQAPDLANVRELALGVWNRGSTSLDGEVWINELRLAEPLRDVGAAGFVDARLEAADVLDARVTYTNRGAFFRQLEETPTYQQDQVLSVTSRLRLDRFLPETWGVEVPLSFAWDRSTQDPAFLADSDLRAELLPDLREVGLRQTRFALGFRRTGVSDDPVASLLLDGLDARVGWVSSRSSSVTAVRESQGLDARLGWERRPEVRDIGMVPGFLEPVLRALLPGFLEDPVVEARLRWSPERVSVGTSYLRQDNDIFRFDQIIDLPRDSLIEPTRAPRESLETVAEVGLRPFRPLMADLTFLSTRDLLPPRDAVADTSVQRLLARERARLAGVDLGWETRRTLRTRIDFRPELLTWLEPGVRWTSRFASDRNASFVQPGEADDTLRALPRSAGGNRELEAFVSLDPETLAGALVGEPGEEGGEGEEAPAGSGLVPGALDGVATVLRSLLPVSVRWSEGLGSRWDRETVDPGTGYQLGLGSRADFRSLDGDTAATFSRRRGWSVGSGLQLAPGIRLDAAFRSTETDILDTRSERTVTDELWPDLRLRIDDPDGLEGTPVDRLGVSAGLQRNRREERFGGPAEQRRTRDDLQVPLELDLSLMESVTLRYTGAVRDGEGVDPTGDTERDRDVHRVVLGSSVAAPGWLLPEGGDRTLRLQVIWSYTGERECRVARARAECVPFVDQINRALSVTLDTTLRGFDVGMQGSWSDRQSYVGRRTGSTQFQLTVFGQFLFEAGRMATLVPPGPAGGPGIG